MHYLYHRVPKELRGSILYPLNDLKKSFPDIYDKEVKKYETRANLLHVRIPPLDCLWNDVLHLTAVHPAKVKRALIEAGQQNDFQMVYFEIDPRILDASKAVVYRYIQKDNSEIEREDNFIPFDLKDLESLARMPEETRDYYKGVIGKGEKPLLYHRIPHVLYKGSIDISQAKIISV